MNLPTSTNTILSFYPKKRKLTFKIQESFVYKKHIIISQQFKNLHPTSSPISFCNHNFCFKISIHNLCWFLFVIMQAFLATSELGIMYDTNEGVGDEESEQGIVNLIEENNYKNVDACKHTSFWISWIQLSISI